MGYYFLGKDWRETAKEWREGRRQDAAGHDYRRQPHRDRGARQIRLRPQEGFVSRSSATPEKMLHIDSKVLDEAEAQEEPPSLRRQRRTTKTKTMRTAKTARPKKKLTKKQQAELLRKTVDTVGRAAAGRADSERHLGRHAFRRLGRQDRHPHHGPARVYVQLFASRLSGAACGARLRGRTRDGAVSSPSTSTSSACRSRFCRTRAARRSAAPPPKARPQLSPIPEQKAQYEMSWPNVIRVDHVTGPALWTRPR